jgi:hypothetical protein
MRNCSEHALKRVPERLIAWRRKEVRCGLLQIADNDLLLQCDKVVDNCYRYRGLANTTIPQNDNGPFVHRSNENRDYSAVDCHAKRRALPAAHRRQMTGAGRAHPLNVFGAIRHGFESKGLAEELPQT